MVTKLADVHSNVNTEKNVFYSAYLKGKVQYNDVDPDKLLKIENMEDNQNTETSKSNDYTNIQLDEKKEEEHKIVVINYDISSNPSSSDNLQKLEP